MKCYPIVFKCLYLLVVLLLSKDFVYGQEDIKSVTKYISITPPSPQTAALGEYGKAPIGLATGTAQLTVPLYTLSSRYLQLPITLQYSSNGVKVDKIASHTGMDWVLNAGGMISRMVYGSPDESSTWLTPPSTILTGQAGYDFTRNVADVSAGQLLTYDCQPDLFSYNFGDYSGKFTLDQNRNIKLVKFENFKIEKNFQSTDWNFKITTPDGIMYFFGGNGAIEETRNVPTTGADMCETHYQRPSKTGWLLSKIIHPKGDTISFKYQPIETQFDYGISQSFVSAIWPDMSITCSERLICKVDDQSTCLTQSRIYTSNLEEITASNGDRIKFINSPRQDITSDVFVDSIMIFLKKDAVNPFKTIDLEYAYSNSGGRYKNQHYLDSKYDLRLFLTGVTERGGIGNDKKYQFEYEDYNALPSRLSFSQDDYGYYNGRYNDVLIPAPTPKDNILMGEFASLTANRNPDPNYAKYGLLTKVVYPTGGYDQFTYEGHSISKSSIVEGPSSTYTLATKGSGVLNPLVKDSIIMVPYEQKVDIVFDCTILDELSYSPDDHYGYVRVYRLYDNQPESIEYFKQIAGGGQEQYSFTAYASAKYRIEVTAYSKWIQTRAKITFKNNPPVYAAQNFPVAGMRISSVSSYSKENGFQHKRKFYYGNLDNLPISTGTIVENIWDYYETYSVAVWCDLSNEPGNTMLFPQNCRRGIGYSNTVHNLFGSAGNHIYYSSVIESEGDNFENGGKQSTFRSRTNVEADLVRGTKMHGMPISNVAWENGLPISELYFSKVGNTFVPKKKTLFNFKVDARNGFSLLAYLGRKRYEPLVLHSPPTDEFNAFDLYSYTIDGNWFYKDSETTTIYDDNGKEFVTNVSYVYDNALQNLPTKTTTTLSDGTSETLQELYPLDFPAGTAFIDTLKANNFIAAPIEKVKYKTDGNNVKIVAASMAKYYANNKGVKESEWLLENNATLPLSVFKFSNNVMGVLPGTTSTVFSPDTRYKNRLNYDIYDASGQLKQYTLNGGNTNCFIWGYNQALLVAQVKNAIQSDIAYTSFETNEWGNWVCSSNTFITTGGLTGKQYYELSNGAISKSGLTSTKKYIVSFWAKTGASVIVSGTTSSSAGDSYNGWTYNERIVSNVTSIAISGSGNIDELRLIPFGAQMATYTYEPSIGVSGTCNENNKLAFYEYDSFGRLNIVKDQYGKILKQNEYRYMAPVQ